MIHFIVSLFVIFAAWLRGDWKNWHQYHPTMLFISYGVFVYLYLYKDVLLWDFEKHLVSHVLTEVVYTLIVLPLTVLLFLSHYPQSIEEQIFRIAKFVGIFIAMEFLYLKLGAISYGSRWNFGWSLLWDCMMFPMLVLHYKKPVYAYLISVLGFIIFIKFFPMKI